jgi:hypothetical protein
MAHVRNGRSPAKASINIYSKAKDFWAEDYRKHKIEVETISRDQFSKAVIQPQALKILGVKRG